MDFRMGAEADAIREEARAFVHEFMTPEREERIYRSGVSNDPEYTAEIVERGWLAGSWRPEDGGAGWTVAEHVSYYEEMTKADAPTYGPGVTTMIARVINMVGTPEQKAEIVPRALRGEIIMCLGFSEPEAGSDVANAQTRAVRDGDEWVIDGQKMFTSNGHIADYVFLLTRTNTEVAKHKGLTMFLVPMDQPGVEVQAVYTLSGERTNISYYSDVRVSDAWRIGEVDGGWRVMTVSLQQEHTTGFGARIERMLSDAEEWAHSATGPDGRPRIEDADVRTRLARCAAAVEVSLLLQRRSAWMAQEGMVPEAEGPMGKLYSSEAFERCAQELVEVMGPDGLRSYWEPTAPVNGRVEHALRFSLGTTIYAGTSEVQRNIIAQRGLKLPR